MTAPTPQPYATLKAAAEKATPGPWTAISDGDGFKIDSEGAYIAGNYEYEDGGIIEGADAVFIAAADPSTVLALIARLEAAEATMQFANWQSEFRRRREAEARLANVQELLNQPCTQDFVCGRWPGRECVCWKADLREALGGEQ